MTFWDWFLIACMLGAVVLAVRLAAAIIADSVADKLRENGKRHDP